jgi:hypothetical protein
MNFNSIGCEQNSGCTASMIFPLNQIESVTSQQSVHGLLKSQKRASPSDIAGETLPDFINSLIQRAESGMNASVVKAEHAAKQYKPEKPMVMHQVAKSLLCGTCDDV